MPRTLSRASLLAAPALALAMLPFTGLSSAADASQPAAPRSLAAAAPDDGSAWTSTSASPRPSLNGHRRTVNPSDFRGYTLDGDAFASALAKAPRAGSAAARRGKAARIVVPAPTGEKVTFKVVEKSVMQRRLQRRHPDIRTYVGNEVKTGDNISVVVTPTGVHASVRGDHRSWYVDPAYQNDDSLYLSYFGDALPAPEKRLVEPKLSKATQGKLIKGGKKRIGEGPNGVVIQRTYRLAFLTDNTYADYVAPGSSSGAISQSQSDSQVLAAKTLLMARVNQIYNADMAATMVLINGTDKLNMNTTAKMFDANGPCGAAACYTTTQINNGCASALLTRNRYVVGLLAGADNFDIGHIGLGINGGGIASLGVVGYASKAQGCTGLPFPIGDVYAIDYVAHEMGHQFNGPHTFNGNQVNCSSTNRTANNSVEPGSGSSVMAYAGICGSDNLQPHTDPYFSERSQSDIGTLLNATPSTNINEVQMAALTGYDTTKSFTLTYGSATTLPITGTANVAGVSYAYTAAGIKAAIEAAIGGTATVAGVYGGTFATTGFQVTFTGTLAATNVANAVLNTDGTFTGYNSDIIKGGASTNRGAEVTTTNHNPTVTAPTGKTIPRRTPFTLTGSATDSDGDPLIYLWEQNDRGATGSTSGIGLVNNTKANGPLFRVFSHYANVSSTDTLLYSSPGENLADGNPSRTFPDMAQILANQTNAPTGACPTPVASDYKDGVSGTLKDGPVLECFSEFLPTSAYVGTTSVNAEPSLNFRLTARDQRANGGGTSFADVKLLLGAANTGPFQVTSQPTTTSYLGGSTQAVTWDVNGTNVPEMAENVKITLSTDGGQTFSTVLAASTPNDGSQNVTIPNTPTTTARIKIEAVDNYFFDINDSDLTITGTLTNQSAPSISGSPTVGSTLTANPGNWTPSDVTYSYQWFANGVPIAGATSQQFTTSGAQEGAQVAVRVIASKPGYAPAQASSPSVRITVAPIQNTAAPQITGSPTVGSTLSLSNGSWNYNDLTFTYQWYANGNAIRGASQSTYTIPASMVGKTITGKVTASRPGSDAVTATSSNSVTPS